MRSSHTITPQRSHHNRKTTYIQHKYINKSYFNRKEMCGPKKGRWVEL